MENPFIVHFSYIAQVTFAFYQLSMGDSLSLADWFFFFSADICNPDIVGGPCTSLDAPYFDQDENSQRYPPRTNSLGLFGLWLLLSA